MPVFSTTKGIAALTFAVAHSKGLFSYDEKIATYWPEFAQYGKEEITIRQLMAFQSGLCYIDQKLDEQDVGNLDRLAQLLAQQRPAWRPGDYHGYHLFTADWYASEIIRRCDPRGRSLGQYWQDEIVKPLGLEFYIGTPASMPEQRFAVLQEYKPADLLMHMNTMPWGLVMTMMVPNSLANKVMFNLKIKTPAQMALPPYRSLELPGGNGIGQMSSLAKAYSVFATGGRELGLKEETLTELMQPARAPRYGLRDKVLKTEMVYSLGFIKPFPSFPFSPSPRAFGAAGTGGSNVFADPDAQLGFAYAASKLGFHQFNDPRESALRTAVYRCIATLEGGRDYPESVPTATIGPLGVSGVA